MESPTQLCELGAHGRLSGSLTQRPQEGQDKENDLWKGGRSAHRLRHAPTHPTTVAAAASSWSLRSRALTVHRGRITTKRDNCVAVRGAVG